MNVVVSMQDVGPWRKQLTVEVPAPAVSAETERVVRELGQRVRIDGFRRGKVPAQLVRRRYAKDIEREVIERLLPIYWQEAERESAIEALAPPEVDEVRDFEPGGPLTFVATVETRPRVELKNIHDFQLPDPSVEPGDIDVEKAFDDLRARFGTWLPVDRPAAVGDLVSAQITQIPEIPQIPQIPQIGEEPPPEQAAAKPAPVDTQVTDLAPAAGEPTAPDTAAHTPPATPNTPAMAAPPPTEPVEFEVGDKRVWEELSLAVSGLAAGQETAFSRDAQPEGSGGASPERDPAAAAAATGGRQRRFKVRVNAVKERELPALDDALAARVNPQLGGMTALRELVVKRLREARVEERSQLRQLALLEQLRERHPLELPQGAVQREIERIAETEARRLMQRGIRPDEPGLDWQKIREDIRPVAERRVHAELLLDQIADAEPVELTDEEFERALSVLARSQKTTTPAVRRAFEENGKLDDLRQQVRREKTVRHLLGEQEVEPEAAAELFAPHDHGPHADPEAGSEHPEDAASHTHRPDPAHPHAAGNAGEP
jgi:FKBP-type peptidyl-prolyl cis-trans isomerase (trigger factor)